MIAISFIKTEAFPSPVANVYCNEETSLAQIKDMHTCKLLYRTIYSRIIAIIIFLL